MTSLFWNNTMHIKYIPSLRIKVGWKFSEGKGLGIAQFGALRQHYVIRTCLARCNDQKG